MTQPFDAAETAWSPTAMTLDEVPDTGLSFRTWGNPERSKINDILTAMNQLFRTTRGVI